MYPNNMVREESFKILAKELGNRGGTEIDVRKVRMLLSSLLEMKVAGTGISQIHFIN